MIQLVPDAETLLELEPEELAGALMEHLAGLPAHSKQQLNRKSFLNASASQANHYPEQFRGQVLLALGEAWAWLEQEGFLVPQAGNDRDWVRITRRGEKFANRAKLEEYRSLTLLPKDKLDERIVHAVSGPFARGDYDTAVFAAFKQVEVAVRDASGALQRKLGTDLMRDAFKPGEGPLADTTSAIAEQEALSHLFAGAIGFYKNPSGHREAVSDPVAAAEMIIFASHLLRIVGERKDAKQATAAP